MKKRLLALALAGGLLATMLVGCGSSPEETTGGSTPDSSTGTEDSTTEDSDSTTGAALKIAIVSSPSGVDDGSFNEDNYNGVLAFIANNPDSTVTAIREETGASDASVQAVADVVAEYDVLVCCGFQFAGIGALAEANPETEFILVDTYPVGADGAEVELSNIYAMTFAEEESAFFTGMAAALESTTKKVAVVNGIAFPSNVNYQYGFESGVNYANAHYDTGVEIVELPSYSGTDVTGANVAGNYVGTFSDEATGKVVGQSLIDQGCDVILVAAGGSGNGVFTAIKESSGVMAVGCDVDQYDDGVNGSDNIVLTSALKIMHSNVEKQLEAVAAGNFSGGNHNLRADTDSTGYVSETGRHQISDATLAILEETYPLMQDGTIVPAANFNGHTSDNFPGLAG
ncbi:MAG: BMP family ABC transporter substrate-binding protein [Eubacteriales bacterium]